MVLVVVGWVVVPVGGWDVDGPFKVDGGGGGGSGGGGSGGG